MTPKPPLPPDDAEPYNDIEWGDDDDHGDADDEELFQDAKLRGSVGLFDFFSKKMLIVAGTIFLVLILVFSVLSWYRAQFDTKGPQGAEITLNVPVGATLNSYSSTLVKNGVLHSALGFRIYVRTHDVPALQAGEYSFHKNSSPAEVAADIKIGPKQHTDRLVIPEGFRITQIAERVGHIPGFSEQKFLNLAKGGTIRSDFEPADTTSLEGFLFPDTYLLSARDTEETLLLRMRNEFDTTVRQIGLDRSDRAIGHSPYETLIIASMIEAEAKIDVDRGKISQVIENRLNAPMPLQIDATVLYGIGNTKTSLSKKDLTTFTPWNTYAGNGLPSTPIGNPGKKSLQAALSPTPGPWLYYVVSGADGSHAFATTLAEHNKNVAAARAKGLL